jgi:hypothetical protein
MKRSRRANASAVAFMATFEGRVEGRDMRVAVLIGRRLYASEKHPRDPAQHYSFPVHGVREPPSSLNDQAWIYLPQAPGPVTLAGWAPRCRSLRRLFCVAPVKLSQASKTAVLQRDVKPIGSSKGLSDSGLEVLQASLEHVSRSSWERYEGQLNRADEYGIVKLISWRQHSAEQSPFRKSVEGFADP